MNGDGFAGAVECLPRVGIFYFIVIFTSPVSSTFGDDLLVQFGLLEGAGEVLHWLVGDVLEHDVRDVQLLQHPLGPVVRHVRPDLGATGAGQRDEAGPELTAQG